MAIVAADWTITQSTKVIAYIGDDHNGASPSYATVIEFHRWVQSLADDAVASGDDELDITDTNPSTRSTDNIITLINGYTIGDTEAEHLYDGSIIQSDGDTIYDGVVNFGDPNVQIQLIQDGAVLSDDWWNKGAGGAHDGAGDASVLTDSGESWTTNEWIGYSIYNTTDVSQGIITANTGTTITATLEGGTDNDWDVSDAYLIGSPLNSDSAAGISHRFMIKTRDDGVDIDGRRIIGISRRYLNTYSEFKINGTARGNNVLALSDTDDLNNTTAAGTTATWTTVTNTEGLRLIDVDNDGSDEEYYSEWNKDSYTINQFYERMKWLTRDGTASSIYSLNGELFRGITHSFAYDGEAGGISVSTNDMLAYGTLTAFDGGSGTFTVGEAVHEDTATPQWKGRVLAYTGAGATGSLLIAVESGTVEDGDGFTGQSSAATADVNTTPTVVSGGAVLHCLAVDDDGATGNLYVQLLKGTAPSNNIRLYYCGTNLATSLDGTDYLDVDGSVTERTIPTPFIGQSTGSAIIGSYGVGIEAADLSSTDKVFDLTNTQVSPPNNVTNTVAGLVSGEDRVLVAPWDGSSTDTNGDPAIDKDQLSLSGNLTTDNITSVVIAEAIPADTPSSGYIRVTDDDGIERRLHFSSWSTSTFTIDTTDGNEDFNSVNATSGNDIYIAYIDEIASGTTATYTSVQSGSRNLVVVVRDGASTPIKQFISSWSQTTSNQTITAIRTSDA